MLEVVNKNLVEYAVEGDFISIKLNELCVFSFPDTLSGEIQANRLFENLCKCLSKVGNR